MQLRGSGAGDCLPLPEIARSCGAMTTQVCPLIRPLALALHSYGYRDHSGQERKAMSHLLTNFDGMPRVRKTVSHPRRRGIRSGLRRMNAVQAVAMLAIATIAALAVVGVTVTIANEYHSNPWLLSWIPAYCCVTNDCCWEVA